MFKVIMETEYSAEDICSISEDVEYEISEANLDKDKNGFFKGTFTVRVTYTDY